MFLPNFAVLSPADEVSMRALIFAAVEHVGRCSFAPAVPRRRSFTLRSKFEIGDRFNCGWQGSDDHRMGCWFAEAIRAQEALDAEGISCRVIDMYSIKHSNPRRSSARPPKPAQS